MSSSPSHNLRITIGQLLGAKGEEDPKLFAMEQLKGIDDTDLIILPELWTVPYCSRDRYKDLAQSIPGPATEQMGDYARTIGADIIFGLPERDSKDGNIYNTAVWIDHDGEVVAKYRKIHLATERERQYFKSGMHRVSVNFRGVKVGLLICYDLGYFPELARAYALDGARVLVAPSAWGDSYTNTETIKEREIKLASSANRFRVGACARAFENRVFVITSNRVGIEFDEEKGEYVEFVGTSTLHNPKGKLMRALDREMGVFTVEIDTSESLVFDPEGLNPLEERKPECY